MVFVDTSALYAVLDADDRHHAAARKAWLSLLSEGRALFASSYVLVETTALLQHRIGIEAVRVLADDVAPTLDVQWIGAEEHRMAMLALLAANRRALSLVDCSSFEVMRRLGLRTAFSFDAHFAEQGFELLPRP